MYPHLKLAALAAIAAAAFIGGALIAMRPIKTADAGSSSVIRTETPDTN